MGRVGDIYVDNRQRLPSRNTSPAQLVPSTHGAAPARWKKIKRHRRVLDSSAVTPSALTVSNPVCHVHHLLPATDRFRRTPRTVVYLLHTDPCAWPGRRCQNQGSCPSPAHRSRIAAPGPGGPHPFGSHVYQRVGCHPVPGSHFSGRQYPARRRAWPRHRLARLCLC